MSAMDIVSRKLSEITPYEKNAKKHDRAQVDNVAESIRKYGFVQPLVIDRNGVIVIGHCRYAAAKKLRMKEVPCVLVDDLTPEQVNALRIVDNKTNESEWDMDFLSDELSCLDLSDFDFDFGLDDEPAPEDTVEEVPVPDFSEQVISKPGDIWQLGEHRLMCGDSTSAADLEKLTCGDLMDCVVTDPPYNMNYEGAGNATDRKSKKIINDNMNDADFKKFLTSVYETMKAGMKDGASFYVFYKELGKGVFITSLEDAGLTYKQELIWVKNQLVLGGSKYQSMYEPCLFGCKGKRIADWNAGRKERSVIESVDLMDEDELRAAIRELTETEPTDIIRENKPLKNDLHPTMKPVKLLAKFIKNSTKRGETVLDLFGGSGSTMMACEQLGRSCYMMELDPKYVDVIVKRWELLTGKKARLISCDEDLVAMVMLFLYYNPKAVCYE